MDRLFYSLIPTLYEELKREKEEFPQNLAANITLSSLPAKETATSAEEHDLALGTCLYFYVIFNLV